jgi:putative endonuclease
MPLIELGLDKDILPGEPRTSEVGALGEQIAADYLRRRDFRLVASNFRVPVGRNRRGATVTGEIDLIAIEDPFLVFVEVKARSKEGLTDPLASVDLRKQRQIIRAARAYRRLFGIEGVPFRFDAVGIILHESRAPKIELRRAYFTESKFKKKTWSDRNF